MHHLVLFLTLGVPVQAGGSRCHCPWTVESSPSAVSTVAVAVPVPVSTMPVAVLSGSLARRAIVVPKYGALAQRPLTRAVDPHASLTGPGIGVDPDNPGVVQTPAPGGLWRAVASVLRLTARPSSAPIAIGPARR